MASTLKDVDSIEELEQALTESSSRSVLLFKHSLTCPISRRAFEELNSYLEKPDPGVAYRLITVQRAPHVSDLAATRLGIRHETPQAILVRDGQGIWDASHFDITAAALDQAISERVG